MTTFVAAPAAPTEQEVADAIAGDGWWPNLSIAKFREATRIPAAVTGARVREALLNAAIGAATELDAWRAARVAEGHDTLGDVPGLEFGGEKRPAILWRRAVYAYAAADLADTQNDISATDKGAQRHELEATAAADHRRNATIAIRDLLGKTRTKVALL